MKETETNIFITYHSADKETAEKLNRFFKSQGWPVFSSESGYPTSVGEQWSDQLQTLIEEASCVIALWSKDAINEERVMRDAKIAREHDKLMPVTLDGAIPEAFKDLYATQLMEWDGDPNHPEAVKLLETIKSRFQRKEEVQEPKVLKKPIRILSGHDEGIQAAAFSPDGKRVATASSDNTVRIWDAASGDLIQTLSGHESVVNGIAFSPDQTMLASVSQDKTIRIWDAVKYSELTSITGHEGTVISGVFSKDGQKFLTASSDGTARRWDTSSWSNIKTFVGHEGKVYAAVFRPDEMGIITAGQDGAIRVWDVDSGSEIHRIPGHTGPIYAATQSLDGQRLATAGEDRTIKIWDTDFSEVSTPLTMVTGHDDVITSLAFSRDRRCLASGSNDKTARIWDTESLTELTILEGNKDRVSTVAFSPDGRYIATGSRDTRVLIWDLAPGAPQLETDQVKWMADEPAEKDLLNREVLARAMATRLRRFRSDEEYRGLSFLIHIDGPWGSGKTTLLRLLRSELESRDGKSGWLFVNFDSWRQSHVGPPWWFLLASLRNSLIVAGDRNDRRRLRFQEIILRFKRAGALYGAAILVMLLLGILVFFAFRPDQFDFKSIKNTIDGILAVVSAITVFWAGIQFVSRFFFWESVTGAKVFEQSSDNPMNEVAEHFNWLARHTGKPVIFFIDDVDRCSEDYVVELLDALQTLIRGNPRETQAEKARPSIYFIVAADGRWIRKSYETAYKTFAGAVDELARPLGYLFLDKLFQLKVTVPSLSPELQKTFLNEILAIKTKKKKKI